MNDDHLHLAIKRLSSGKAVGVDGLRDLVLKHAVKNVVGCKDKLKVVMQQWLNGKPLPRYVTTAKTFFLSKESSEYPETGNVRIISVLPSITKLYELVLLERLEDQIKIHGLISEE